MDYSFCLPNLREPSHLRGGQIYDEADNSSHEFSDEDQDQLLLILKTYKALHEQGFYEPHVRVTPKSKIERVDEDDGSVSTLIQMHVNAEICTEAPSKVDFINALGYIQPEIDDEALALAKGGADRAWYQFVADKVFPSCKHIDCEKLSVKKLKLIRDCYVEKPRVPLDPLQKHPIYWMTDEYESIKCCVLNSE